MSLKRVGLAITLGCLGLCGAAAAAVPSRAELRGPQCRRSADASGRAVSVTAVMRPVSGTVRMALKFSLERRLAGADFRPVTGRQLGHWVSPGNPTLGENPADVWMLKQNVVNLTAPADYRFRVWFRWTGANNRVLARAVRVSPACYEPDPHPDLAVRSIEVTPLSDGQTRYSVAITNLGGAPTGSFAVRLDPPGGPSQSSSSRSLDPRASEHEVFDGPACAAGSSVTAVADPDGVVDDPNPSNNTLTAPCPAGSSRYTS